MVTKEGLVISKLFSVPVVANKEKDIGCYPLQSPLLTTLDVLWSYSHIHVPVRTTLLVPAPQGMEHLVQNNALKSAAISNGDVLGPPNTSNVGVTPVWTTMYFASSSPLSYKCSTSVFLPLSLKETDIVLLIGSLNKLNASFLSVSVDGSIDSTNSLTCKGNKGGLTSSAVHVVTSA